MREEKPPFYWAKVEKLNIPKGKRVLAISDVHAMREHLENVLKLAHYDEKQDKLILLGDLMEKGPDSLAFLRFLKKFKKGKDLTILRGNCDHLVLETAYGLWPAEVAWCYMKMRPESVLWQMGEEMGFVPEGAKSMEKFGNMLKKHFSEEISAIKSWPVIGETEEAVFVHGGIEQDENLEHFQAHKCMKNDNFMFSEPRLHRWCVVGHTPTTLYRDDFPCSDPIFDTKKKILSIDGGCGIKMDGQLNGVIFPSWGEKRMEFVAYDGLKAVKSLDFQEKSSESRNIHWGQHRVEILGENRGETPAPPGTHPGPGPDATRGEAGADGGESGVRPGSNRATEEFFRCRQVSTGYEMEIPKDFLYQREGEWFTQDITDYRLPVEPGEELKIVKETSRGLLCKKGGVTGWYLGRYE